MLNAIRSAALAGASLIVANLASAAGAEDARADKVVRASVSDAEPQSSGEIVVIGEIGYRNRSESAEPVLIYDTDYFQRFEPLTIGDALKRVPSVTFLSDVIESDGARLRGLDPGYTQVLINGEKVPGANVDRSFFLDRIPAELVDRIEIVRSNSARRTADAVAGTLNIVLRDAFELDGGYIKLGGLLFDDDELEPALGVVWGGAVGPGRLLIGGTIQGRHNPKNKTSLRYGDSPENDPDFESEFDNREDQADTRDGTDYSANASYVVDLGETKLDFGGFYARTDRTEAERSFEYNRLAGDFPPLPEEDSDEPGLLADASQNESIDQENFALTGKARHRWSLGQTSLKAGFAQFDDRTRSTELEIDFDSGPPVLEGTLTRQSIRDREFSLQLDHQFALRPGMDLIVGGFYQDKDRDTDIRAAENDTDLTEADRDAFDQFVGSPRDFPLDLVDFEAVPGGLNRIEERRHDLFALVEGKNARLAWEIGARYETTDVSIDDFEADERFDNDYALLLPSASIKFDLTPADRITASVARTNRRPRFDFISPALLEEEFGDHDFRGNPELEPETAWGVDIGYERRIGRTGVAGVNVFYRKVRNLVEIAATGELGSNDVEIFAPRNSGDGEAWGIEFDLSTSLAFVGLPDTGIFGNYSWLDSETEDELGKRRFNGQSKYVYNFGFIQDLRSVGAAFGATYRKQGSAIDRFVGEEVRTSYGADLELFVEKRLWDRLTIRAVGTNLLNGAKQEVFNKFDTLADQIDRDLDEYEIESEKAGPVFQLIGRLAF